MLYGDQMFYSSPSLGLVGTKLGGLYNIRPSFNIRHFTLQYKLFEPDGHICVLFIWFEIKYEPFGKYMYSAQL